MQGVGYGEYATEDFESFISQGLVGVDLETGVVGAPAFEHFVESSTRSEVSGDIPDPSVASDFLVEGTVYADATLLAAVVGKTPSTLTSTGPLEEVNVTVSPWLTEKR